MDADTQLAHLAADGGALLAAARRAGWDTPVPGLTWDVRALVVHTGAVHRWSADIVRRALPTNETGGSIAFHPGLADDDLPGWYAEGLAALVATLREAPADLEAFTFTRGLPARAFWIRRQLHETCVHRLDAEAAAGSVTDVPVEVAQDGIDELAAGFARSRAFAVDVPGTLSLAATDGPAWLVRFGGERIEAAVSDEPGAATVTGTSSELYRWLWNRPSPVVVGGDPAITDLWRRVRIT